MSPNRLCGITSVTSSRIFGEAELSSTAQHQNDGGRLFTCVVVQKSIKYEGGGLNKDAKLAVFLGNTGLI